MCCLPWSHAEAIEAVPGFSVSPDVISTAKVSIGGVFQPAAWGGFPLLFPISMFLLLFACGCGTLTAPLTRHSGSSRPPKTHPTAAHLRFPLHLCPHNPCATTAGRNALPSPAAALKAPSQFIFPLNCAQLSGPVAAPAARRALGSAAEAFCHPRLAAPNPPRWLRAHQRLMKKQMAVTDTVCNCGQLIAEDKSEIRTKRWWPAAAGLTLPGIASVAWDACTNPELHYGTFQFPFSVLFLPFRSFQGFRAYQNN